VKIPQPLFPVWPKLAKELRAARRRVLLCDFDGTLVGIRRQPGQVYLSQATRRLLVRLRESGTVVGVVSGRSLEDLEARMKLPGLWYVGSHGYRLREPSGRLFPLATAAERERVRRAGRWLGPRVKGLRGVKLDWKHASLAVHYRNALPSDARKAEAIVAEALARDPKLRLIAGKKVWELLPGESVDKGTAVAQLLKREKAKAGGRDFVAYLGDDTTDESVFRKMKSGVTIVVGRRTHTAARYFLKSPGEVRKFLRLWLAATQENGTRRREAGGMATGGRSGKRHSRRPTRQAS
jgi:alpha,alpha-trehalase